MTALTERERLATIAAVAELNRQGVLIFPATTSLVVLVDGHVNLLELVRAIQEPKS